MNNKIIEIITTRIKLLAFDADQLADKIQNCYELKDSVTGDLNKMTYYRMSASRSSGTLEQVKNELEFLNLLLDKFANDDKGNT